MEALPTCNGDCLIMKIKIQRAKPRHADAIHAIENEAFSDPWSIKSILYEIEENHSVFLVATNIFYGIVGYASMRHVINEGHISNIAVSVAHKNKGIGTLLMEGLEEEARLLEMIGLTLEVRASNEPAIALYEKFGFEPEGIRKNLYSYPTEDGIIMWRWLQYGS